MINLRLDICRECVPLDAEDALAELQKKLARQLADQVSIRLAPCIERCDAPCAMTLQSAQGAGYVFSGINLAADADDIVETCRAYLSSKDGWIEDARPCGRLRFCLAARLPA